MASLSIPGVFPETEGRQCMMNVGMVFSSFVAKVSPRIDKLRHEG